MLQVYADRVWTRSDLDGRKLNASEQLLLGIYNAALAIFKSERKLYLGHILPHQERAGKHMFNTLSPAVFKYPITHVPAGMYLFV